jgi:hypothetical protein
VPSFVEILEKGGHRDNGELGQKVTVLAVIERAVGTIAAFFQARAVNDGDVGSSVRDQALSLKLALLRQNS